MNAIETRGLSKLFTPSVGLKPLDLSVQKGEIFGFLGPNGAGKTTAIRTLLGFLRPTSGAATIGGYDVWQEREAVHRLVGYLAGEVHLPRDQSAHELMQRSARLYGTGRREPQDTTYGLEVARRLDLNTHAKLGTLSKGNKQKVGLTLALMHRPAVLLLDEPTDGLDPLVQETVLELLREARAEGRTVFLSSHVLSEVERVADRVGIIRAGELVRLETLSELRSSLPQRVMVQFAAPPSGVWTTLAGLSAVGLSGVVPLNNGFTAWWRGDPNALLRALAAENVQSLSLTPATLEDAFLDEYRHGAGGDNHVA